MVTITPTSSAQQRSFVNHAWWFRIVIAFLALVSFRVLLSASNSSSYSLRSSDNAPPTMPLTDHTIRIYKDNELAYMIPKNPIGVLIFFHGCNHSGEDFFFLPEDRLVAAEAYKRNLVVLTITAQDPITGCWSKNADLKELSVVDAWMENVVKLDLTLPRIAIGASSGGAMVTMATQALDLKAVASYIMAIPYEDEASMVPTAYVHMPRDTRTAANVKRQVLNLQQAGVNALELTLEPHPFNETVCNHRIPELGKKTCHKLIQSARKKKLLDSSDVVQISYRDGGAWEAVLGGKGLDLDAILKKQKLPDTDFYGHSRLWAAVAEEINVAYGHHEMSAEHASQVLDFLMRNAGIVR